MMVENTEELSPWKQTAADRWWWTGEMHSFKNILSSSESWQQTLSLKIFLLCSQTPRRASCLSSCLWASRERKVLNGFLAWFPWVVMTSLLLPSTLIASHSVVCPGCPVGWLVSLPPSSCCVGHMQVLCQKSPRRQMCCTVQMTRFSAERAHYAELTFIFGLSGTPNKEN